MAVDYLSAINKQGSGLNITQIVDSLVQAETAPISSQITKNIEQKSAAVSGYAVIASELGKLKDFSVSAQGSSAYAVTSDNSAIGVKVLDQSQAKAFDGSLTVSALASSQTLEFESTNPFVITLGDAKKGSHRLNLAGGVNSFGTVIGPIILGLLLFNPIDDKNGPNLGNVSFCLP